MDRRLDEFLNRLALTRGQVSYGPASSREEDLREFQNEIDDIEVFAGEGLLKIIGTPHRESRTGKRYTDRIKIELTAKGAARFAKGEKEVVGSDISTAQVEESGEPVLVSVDGPPTRELKRLKKNFDEQVVSAFQSGSSMRGQGAFELWKKEFVSFLEEYLPQEVNRFEQLTFHRTEAQMSQKQDAYNTFMQRDGKASLAFLATIGDQLEGGLKSDRGNRDRPQVFISYAREDSAASKRLSKDLRNAGIMVWLDTEALLPGQNWKSTIRKAIKESRYVIALLSRNSVTKKGYVQRELKDALDVLQEYPASSIFIIPARLDECSPSDERIADLHWVDLFENWDDGINRILKTITESLP